MWSEIDTLSDENRMVISAFLQSMEEEHPDIPYGFGIDGQCFDEDGNFVTPPPGEGLTCATFVVEVLRQQGFDILVEDSWPIRAEDEAWRAAIIQQLELSGSADAPHIAALAAKPTTTRVRPDEVAAACLNSPIPNEFASIVALAEDIYAQVNKQPVLR